MKKYVRRILLDIEVTIANVDDHLYNNIDYDLPSKVRQFVLDELCCDATVVDFNFEKCLLEEELVS